MTQPTDITQTDKGYTITLQHEATAWTFKDIEPYTWTTFSYSLDGKEWTTEEEMCRNYFIQSCVTGKVTPVE